MADDLFDETPEIVLQCQGLHRYLGVDENRVHVLNDVSLTLYEQRVYSVMGPSGCGKSTLLYLLGLLDRADSGTIRIAGHEVSGLDEHSVSLFRNQEIGFVFQFHFLLKEFTATENVQLPMRRAGLLDRAEMEERAASLLELVGLGDKIDRQAQHLLLADEPTGNLDTMNSHRIFEVLQSIARETGLALLIVTHNRQVAEASDYVFQMQDGQLVE
jgi:lipoprotein-releasing system ATP-binding protein